MPVKKRAVFFSIDALIAIIILFSIILIAYPLVQYQKSETELHRDLIVSLSSLKIGEINNSFVLSLNETISDKNKSVLEQIGELYITNPALAKELANSVLNTLTINENIGIWYENTLIFSRNSTPIEKAKNIETARQLISGIMEGSNITGYSTRVSLSSKTRQEYAYFGGYVGDGNISQTIAYNGNISSAEMELAINENFELYVNDNFVGNYEKSPSEFAPIKHAIPTSYFHTGENRIDIRGSSIHISGGFIKIIYNTEVQYQQPTKKYLPGVDGIVNIYDGLHIPGQLTEMNIFLHYNSSYRMFLNIGNITVFNSTSTEESTTTIPNSSLITILNYNSLSNKTTPIRLGLQEILTNGTGGSADVILITDTSGSMNWRMNSDSTGTSRNCTDPLLNASTTKRISLAKCIDIDFVNTIVGVAGNRIGLVSFSASANNYVNLTTNQVTLNNAINNYIAGGSTCVACAINRAYQILQSQSNSTRAKFIVVMTDGVANVRATSTCNSIYGGSSFDSENIFGGGQTGLIIKRSPAAEWNTIASPTSSQINDIEFLDQNLGFAVGNGGIILQWNGASWSSMSSPLTTALNGVDIYNANFALAVGASGKVIKWDGSSWSNLATISNSPTLNSIKIYNTTLIFAVGTRNGYGKIYKSVNGGANWAEDYSFGNNFRGIEIVSANKAYAVGSSGAIAQWSGASWSQMSSPTIHNLYAIKAINTTRIFAVGGDAGYSRIIKFNGASWTSDFLDSTTGSLRDIIVFNSTAYAVGLDATLVEFDSSWKVSFKFPQAFSGNLTTGTDCSSDDDSCIQTNSYPSLNANYSSCRAHRELNSTVYSVGFGPIATCAFARQTLQGVADCGEGTFYSSSDAAELQQFYNNIANDIIKIAYTEQISQITGNVSSRLYPDSYINFEYSKSAIPYGLIATAEKRFDDNLTGAFSIPPNSSILETKVISYSGPRWTAQISINNITAYNLTAYGSYYVPLGDPYAISIPNSLINTNNTITLKTGTGPKNITNGSENNKIIYTIAKSASAFSSIRALASGCIWLVNFEDNTNITMNVPEYYSGADSCTYSPSSFNSNDAYQESVNNLLKQLDFNNNGKIDTKFTAQEMVFQPEAVSGIPFLGTTEVEVRIWN